MNLIIKGVIIGIGKIFPGVSGALLAISFNLYDKLINIIANLNKTNKEKIVFLLKIGIGVLIGIYIGANILKNVLLKYYTTSMAFFLGLILGSIPQKNSQINRKKLILFLLSFIFITVFSNTDLINLNNINKKILFVIMGTIEAFSSIVPGISGTAIFVSLNIYDLVLNYLSKLNSEFLIGYSIGIGLGAIIICKIISFLQMKLKNEFEYIIYGFIFASIFAMINNININNWILETTFVFLGFFTIKILNNFLEKT